MGAGFLIVTYSISSITIGSFSVSFVCSKVSSIRLGRPPNSSSRTTVFSGVVEVGAVVSVGMTGVTVPEPSSAYIPIVTSYVTHADIVHGST